MIILHNISKRYHRQLVGKGVTYALNDVNLLVRSGDSLAVMGPNGSGKSTLLRVILGVTKPDSGIRTVQGRIGALIELVAGFHPNLSGKENVIDNGVLQGMSYSEAKAKCESIIDFAELKEFANEQVKHYSTGMFVRLGFALTVHLDADIFLIDEVLAVGDGSFQQKGIDKLKSLSAAGKTLVFVTHNPELAKKVCSSEICMERGKIIGRCDGQNKHTVVYQR